MCSHHGVYTFTVLKTVGSEGVVAFHNVALRVLKGRLSLRFLFLFGNVVCLVQHRVYIFQLTA